MKAPDKVYVKKEKDNVTFSLSVQYDNGGEQYIRKEALMEWLEYEKEWFEGTDIEPHYQKVIDQLNSM